MAKTKSTKAAGKKTPRKRAAKKAATKKASAKRKVAKKKSAKSTRGKRYSEKLKKEVVDFVNGFNAEKGRGGTAAAVKKFKITALTISKWVKGAGSKRSRPAAARKTARPKVANIYHKLATLAEEIEALERVEAQLAAKRAEFERLKKQI